MSPKLAGSIPYLLALLILSPLQLHAYTGAVQVGGSEYQVTHCNPRGTFCTKVWVTGGVSVTVNGVSVGASFGQGSTQASVASALCAAMSSSFPATCTGQTNGTSSVNLSLTASANHPFSSSCWISSPSEAIGGCAFRALPLIQPTVRPTAMLLSVLYDPPGIGSSNGYSNSTTYGTTTTISNSFQAGTTTTFSVTTGIPGFTSTTGWSWGFGTVSGNSSAFTWSVTQGQGVSNVHGGSSNAVNHAKSDLFVLWINPEVTLTQQLVRTVNNAITVQYYTPTNGVTYSISTPLQEAGQPNPGQPHTQDIVDLSAAELQNPSLIPETILAPHTLVTGETLPGVAAICANQTYYPNSCSADPNHACGCVASDFQALLNADPVLNFARAQNPTTVNTSGNTRYDLIYSSELLSGPACSGCNTNPNTFIATDSTQTTSTSTSGYSYSQGFSKGYSLGSIAVLGFSLQYTNANTWTWTNTESIGTINGQSHQMQVSLVSPTVGCSEYTGIYEDTVFHTFEIQENATEDSTCP